MPANCRCDRHAIRSNGAYHPALRKNAWGTATKFLCQNEKGQDFRLSRSLHPDVGVLSLLWEGGFSERYVGVSRCCSPSLGLGYSTSNAFDAYFYRLALQPPMMPCFF